MLDAMRNQENISAQEPTHNGSAQDASDHVLNHQSPPNHTDVHGDVTKPSDGDKKDGISSGGTASPSQSSASYPHALPANLTPQQHGYYVAYQSQITPESPSPNLNGTSIYDVGATFLQQPGFHPNAFPPHHYSGNTSQGHGAGQAPASPSQTSMGGIPPASPLFPRMTGQAMGYLDPHGMMDVHRGTPVSPSPAYISPALGPTGGMYLGMGGYNGHTPTDTNNENAEDASGWNDGRNSQGAGYIHSSPQIGGQGMPIPYVPGMPTDSRAGVGGRSYSFGEESMLPPPADTQQQQNQSANFSSYNQSGAGVAGNMFAHQQAWGYGGPPPDMYGASASPLQPRPTMAYPVMHSGMMRPPGAPQMSHYGNQFYPATSPGPPIQTTVSNKGPDGANLFIFHIPNNFTNLDMYQLFYPYGHLLSVRIMVEKDTGRSRGFGFVSYDSPDAAALAIKELNGYAIGNKRLKVQHKQIRPSDQHSDRGHPHSHDDGQEDAPGNDGYNRSHMSLPPSGPNAWFGHPRTTAPIDLGGNMESATNSDTTGAPPKQEDSHDVLSNFDSLREALPEEGEVSK